MSQPEHSFEFMRRTAENYERYFVPSIGAPVAADLMKERTFAPASVCSTLPRHRSGDEARRGVRRSGRAGADPNAAMLAVARATAQSDASIEWHQAPAEALPSPDESFDVVLCGMGLQFFSDKDVGLREFHRVLVPGGRLVPTFPVRHRRRCRS